MTYRRTCVNHVTTALLVKELMGGATCAKLADITGLNVKNVRRYMAAWRRLGVVFRSGWEPNARGAMRVEVFRLKLTKYETDVAPDLAEATIERRARQAGS